MGEADSITSFKQLAGDTLTPGSVPYPERGATGKEDEEEEEEEEEDDGDDDDDDDDDDDGGGGVEYYYHYHNYVILIVIIILKGNRAHQKLDLKHEKLFGKPLMRMNDSQTRENQQAYPK